MDECVLGNWEDTEERHKQEKEKEGKDRGEVGRYAKKAVVRSQLWASPYIQLGIIG